MSIMRILFLNGHPLYAGGLAAGLRQIGHDVRVFDPVAIPRGAQGSAVAHQIDEFRPHVAISMGHVDHFMNGVEVFGAVRRRGIFHIYWATEDRPFHREISMKWARRAQAVFTLDEGYLSDYRALGRPAEVLPFACNPAVHHGYPVERGLQHDILLVANNTPSMGTYRQQSLIDLLEPMLGGGYDLAVWGYNWHLPFAPGLILPQRFYYGILGYDQAVRAACSAKIVLGPQWDAQSPTQVSCRTFETLGAGGFLLTSDIPGVHRYFRNGYHLLTTDCSRCTKAMIDHFLAAESERRSVAAQGQSFVHAQHTYVHRACQFSASVEHWLLGRGWGWA